MKIYNDVMATCPDVDLCQRVSQSLSTHHFRNFRLLDVEASQGSVTVTGRVDSYYEKQVAMTSCQQVEGVLSLIDEIIVVTD